MAPFLRRGLVRIALLMVLYTLCRVLFLFWNWPQYSNIPASEWLWAFIYGLRFDLSAIVFTNAVVMVLWLLPAAVFSGRWFSWLEIAVFFVINWICIGSSVVDAEFVNFIGKRSSYDMLLIQQDLKQHGFSVIATYWYFCLALTLTIVALCWLSPKMQGVTESPTWLGKIGWRIVAIVLLVTAARGGYQFKPLSPMHAYFSTRHELGLLTLNTPFNVIKTQPKHQVERQRFFATDKEAIEHLNKITKLSRPPLGVAKDFNVVVLIIESLGTEYMGVANDHPGYTPYLDSLAREPGSFYFKNNFANGRRSIEAVPAVICGIPAIMQEPVITSDFSNNRYDCLPNILGRKNYPTHFLHGAHNGSMHFDTFSRIAGFQTFVGLNEYPKNDPEDLDKYWGVLDEPMLQYAVKTLDEAKQPAFVSVFTLSSHHPYYIPEKYAGKFPKGLLEIHESIGYVDHSLKNFFAAAKDKPWFNKTIFVITGDHTQKVHYPQYHSMLGYYKVPLYIFVPGLKDKKLDFDPERITQHSDILPSIMDLLGVELPDRLLVGQSVFDSKVPGRAYNFNSPNYWYLDPNVYIRMDRTGAVQEMRKHLGRTVLAETKPQPDKKLSDEALMNLRSLVHYLNEGLVKNSLYSWRSAL